MAYTAVYNSADLSPMFMDFFGGIFVGLAQNAVLLGSLLVIAVLLSLITKALKGTFNIFTWIH